MTNKEKYKQAFSVLHTSDDFALEVKTMKHTNHSRIFRSLATAAAAVVIVLASATTAYAMDLGGIRQKIQVWIHGSSVQADVEFYGDGGYSMDYIDENGNVQNITRGGGVAFNEDGSERPLTQDEVIEYMDTPEIEYKKDGSVWAYWRDQKVDITDKFEDGICYVKLVHNGESRYITVKFHGSYVSSPNRYSDPSEFN